MEDMQQESNTIFISEWEKIFTKREWGKYPAESLVRFIAQNYYQKDREQTKILEVGCGPGPNIWYMAKERFDVYGIDNSPTAIRKAEQRLFEENLDAKLAIANIQQLPFQDNFFDSVVDCECIYCNSLSDTYSILKEIYRVLKKGGRFYSRTFSSDQFVGNQKSKISPFEYEIITEGVLANTGFARLTAPDQVDSIYGRYFNVISVDKINTTRENGNVETAELVIICEKI